MAIHYKCEEYDKISDTLIDFWNGYVFRANVKVSYFNGKDKVPFATEYRYSKGEYQNIMVRREMKEASFTIERKKSSDQMQFPFYMTLYYPDIIDAQNLFEAAYTAMNSKYDQFWTTTPEGEVTLRADNKTRLSTLIRDKEASMSMTVHRQDKGGVISVVPAVILEFDDNYIILTRRNVNAILYILDSTSLVLAAQSMVTHLHSPYIGDKIIDISTEGTMGRIIPQPAEPGKEVTGGAVKREPAGKKNKNNISNLL